MTWPLDQLAERDARIAELEARRQRNGWVFALPETPVLARPPDGM